MNYKYKTYIITWAIFSTCLLLISCKKFVTVPPPSYQLISDEVFKNDNTANSAIAGIYSQMMLNQNQFCASSTTLYTGLYSDELSFYSSSDRDEFINSNLTQSSHNIILERFWAPAYQYIYTANICIEKLTQTNSLTQSVKEQLLGETKFVRAFCFFYLINLFGEVPLTLSTDHKINQNLKKSPVSDVLEQILSDLREAKDLLPESYSLQDKIRPNKWSAATLLARVYLYMKMWPDAERESTAIINSGLYSLNSDLNKTFLKSSTEAIWQLQPVNPNWNTWEGAEILFTTNTTPPTYILRDDLLDSFEEEDLRKKSWVQSRTYLGDTIFYPYKYKVYGNNAPLTEYYMVFRLAITKRELEIISLIGDELTTKEIASKLYLSKRTIDTHRQNLMQKLHVKNNVGIIKVAIQNDLLYF